MTTRPATLYVTYDGILEPLGESQVLGYVERLARTFDITLVSFEKAADARQGTRTQEMRSRLESAGIRWDPRRYHKSPAVLSTAFDVLRGIYDGLSWSRRTGGRIVHARGYVPALIALALRTFRRTLFLFDMRGFWADEKVDGGHWARDSWLYRLAKRCERRFFESADAIVSLTEAGVREFPHLGYSIPAGIPVEVVPTCADVARFTPGAPNPALAAHLGLAGHPVLGCVGTMSNWYLREPMLDYLAYLLDRLDRLKVLVVTADDHDALRGDASRRGVDLDRCIIMRAPFSEMPDLMRLMDVGMFFIKPAFSKKGSAATKLGEFLACGVPVVINDGIGDSGEIVRERGVGVVLPRLDHHVFEESLESVRALFGNQAIRQCCRRAAVELFDIDRGASQYAAIYAAMLERSA